MVVREGVDVDERPDAAVFAAFVVGGVFAGGNAIGIRFTVDELDPLWGAGFRFVIAALVLGIVVVVRHRRVIVLSPCCPDVRSRPSADLRT